MPEEFHVHLFERATESGVVYGSKAVGEPPLMLAFCVREALRQAVAPSARPGRRGRPGQPGDPGGRLLGARGRPARRSAAPRCRSPGRPPHRRESDHGLVESGNGSCGTTAARGAGHGDRRPRARAPRRRRQDGGRRRRGPGAASAAATSSRPPSTAPGSMITEPSAEVPPRPDPAQPARADRARPAVLRRRGDGCCSSRCPPGRRSRSSGSATSATRWPGSCPGWGVRLHLVDSRAEELEALRLADITDGHRRRRGPPGRCSARLVLERLPRGAHVLIMTHDHAEDFALCDAALRLPEGAAGRHRADRVVGRSGRFRTDCWPSTATRPDRIDRITCPIGLPEIAGKEPAVIAIGVAAALLAGCRCPALRRHPVGRRRRSPS